MENFASIHGQLREITGARNVMSELFLGST
jgi:hypothetical protein